MTFEQMNESAPQEQSPATEPQTGEEFAGDADLGGGGKKPQDQGLPADRAGGRGLGGDLVHVLPRLAAGRRRRFPSDGGTDIKQFLDSGNINLMKQTLKDTEKVVQQFRTYPAQTQVPLASLHSNPFRELPPRATRPRQL